MPQAEVEVLCIQGTARNVREIVLAILTDAGMYATGDELQNVLPGYHGIDNYAVLDDLVIRTCGIQELAISANRQSLKYRVHKQLRSELMQALGAIADLLVS